MFDFLPELFRNPFVIPIVAIVAGVAIPTISSAWVDQEKHKEECELKRLMIERGMSVEEIERVVAANKPPSSKE